MIRYVRWNSTEGNPHCSMLHLEMYQRKICLPKDNIHSNMDHCHNDLPNHWVSGCYTLEYSTVYMFTVQVDFHCHYGNKNPTKNPGQQPGFSASTLMTQWHHPGADFDNCDSGSFDISVAVFRRLTLGCLRSTEDNRKQRDVMWQAQQLHEYLDMISKNLYFSISK